MYDFRFISSLIVSVGLALTACAGQPDDVSSSRDPLEMRELTGVEVQRLMAFANGATAEELAAVPGVSESVETEILESRPFTTVDEINALPGVGPTTLMVLVAYVSDRGNNHPDCPEPSDPGVCFSLPTAIAMVNLANDATYDQLAGESGINLSDDVSTAVVENRPYKSLEQVAAVSGIGPYALLKFEAMVYQIAQSQ